MTKQIEGIVLQLMEQQGDRPNPNSDIRIGQPNRSGIRQVLGGVIGQMQLEATDNRYIATNCPDIAAQYGFVHYEQLGYLKRARSSSFA